MPADFPDGPERPVPGLQTALRDPWTGHLWAGPVYLARPEGDGSTWRPCRILGTPDVRDHLRVQLDQAALIVSAESVALDAADPGAVLHLIRCLWGKLGGPEPAICEPPSWIRVGPRRFMLICGDDEITLSEANTATAGDRIISSFGGDQDDVSALLAALRDRLPQDR